MKTVLTYVVHNCFCVEIGDSALVFDYPAASHRPPGARDIVRRAAEGREAYVFFSHSHADHCSPDVLEAVKDAKSLQLVLSYDVPDMVPELDLPGAVVVEPGDGISGGVLGAEVRAGGVTVSAIESNDLGVAFFVTVGDRRIYFGGDLAAWTWPESGAVAQKQTQAFFANSLKAVAAFAPHVAFSDCDHRLPNRSGFSEFMQTVQADVYVPMHDFGDPANIRSYVNELEDAPGRVAQFEKTGDKLVLWEE